MRARSSRRACKGVAFPRSPIEILLQRRDLTRKKNKNNSTRCVRKWLRRMHLKKKKENAIHVGKQPMLNCVNLFISLEFQSLGSIVGEKDASGSYKFVLIEACRGSRLYSGRFTPCTKLISIIVGAADRTQIIF